MKPTKTNLSKYYGITTRTLRNWELSTDGRQHAYEALKAYYVAHAMITQEEKGNR